MSSPRLPPVVLFGDTYRHANVFYRCRFLNVGPVILVDWGDRNTTLWVSRNDFDRARRSADVAVVRSTDELGIASLLVDREPWPLILELVCKAHGLNEIRVEGEFPVAFADWLRERGVKVTPSEDLYEPRRRCKTSQEVEWIAQSQGAALDAVKQAVAMIAAAPIRDGLLQYGDRAMQGSDLVAKVEGHLSELGYGTVSTICCGGPESCEPNLMTSPVIRAGLPIILDVFPFNRVSRYWGDLTCTVVRGTPTPEVQAMCAAAVEAQQVAVKSIKPGVNGREVHLACCETFKRHGFGSLPKPYSDLEAEGKFLHMTGHGVGLQLHEEPLVDDVDVILQVGDTIGVEPGVYHPRFGGVRIEEVVVVTEAGCQNVLPPHDQIFLLDA